MTRASHAGQLQRRTARAGEALVSNRLLALATLLRRSANLLYRRELGLSQVEWRILAMLGDQAPLTLGALVEILGLDKGQLSRTVTALVKRRILTRVADAQDGREVHIAFTPRGQELYGALMALALERNRELAAGLSRAEIAVLRAVLDRLLANARIMLAQSQTSRAPVKLPARVRVARSQRPSLRRAGEHVRSKPLPGRGDVP